MPRVLTLACGDYDRTHPLIDASVKPEGLELNWLVLPHYEIWTRMLNYYDFDASEISLSSYLIARTMGKPLTAIPVFPARAFRHSYVFINTRSGIREPKDLMGKRVGLAEFQQTATVWVRGMLQHEYGLKLEDIEWFTWVPRQRMEIEMPKRYSVRSISPDRQADQMLFDGELDAVICANLFPSLLRPPSHVRRLFENYEAVEAAYFRKTGIFPIMHSIALRQELWEQSPWIARSLFKAFQRAKENAYERLNDISPYKISLAWFRRPVEEQRAILGEDPWPYGLEKNRHVVATLMEYLYEQGLAREKLDVNQLFAPNTLDL
ncbi:MAG TPA: ABC transporter substrate-binding protein [Candidatus Binatia bacterium]|nr:ABC transporter substrate-binding protein [Candidatus Binatia bacterium]